jgi:hypothetical protein
MNREDANRAVEQRQAIIYDMMVLDGVPADIITAVALMGLGVRMYHDLLRDNTRLAAIVQEWADMIRDGHDFGPSLLKD